MIIQESLLDPHPILPEVADSDLIGVVDRDVNGAGTIWVVAPPYRTRWINNSFHTTKSNIIL